MEGGGYFTLILEVLGFYCLLIYLWHAFRKSFRVLRNRGALESDKYNIKI